LISARTLDSDILSFMKDTLSTWLNTELRERGWTERELARRAGLSHTAINNALSGQYKTRLDTYRGIAHAFEMSLEDVFRAAGVLPPLLPPVAEEEEMIALFRGLPPTQRAAALYMLRGLDAHHEPAHAPRREAEITDYTTAKPPVTRESLVARLNRLWDVATEEQLRGLLTRLLEGIPDKERLESRGDLRE